MALTIAIEGKGVIANCDALTNDTGGTGTGDWTEEGGGTMTLSPDVYLYGTGSIGGKYASKSGLQQFDLGAGNELDFTATTGTEAGQFIYMWVNMAAFGVLDTLANYGLCIRISSDSPGTTNYVDYRIGDSTDANGWTGGWKLFVIDPTITGSRVSGTQSTIIASVRTMGIWIDTVASVRAESLWIDQIAVASGLRITGTSTTGWKDVVDYCTDFSNRAWGMMQERDGIYYQFGKMYIGDSTQSADTSFADSGRVIQYGTSQFYDSTNAWSTSFSTSGAGIVIEDHATYKTTFTDGVIVGTDNGRSGSVIIGNADQDVSMDLYGGNHTDSVTAFYGTTLKDITGAINSGNDIGHKFLGVSFISSAQFDPVGAPVIRNSTFAETTDVDAALLWNESIDIEDCSFIANTLGAGIEMPSSTGTPYAYNALSFSGNTYDVLNSSGSAIEINKNDGSNPSSSEGSSVTFLGVSVDTDIYVKNTAGTAIENARVLAWVTDNSNYFYEATVSITGTGTTATVTHTSHGLTTGDSVIIGGVTNDDDYNGAFSVTVTDANTYTYTTSETLGVSPATGTIVSTFAVINELSAATTGLADDTRSWGVAQPIAGRVRKSSATPYYQQATFSGTISISNGLSINVQLISDE